MRSLDKVHEVQLVNYLTATGTDTGLLLNFGPSVQVNESSVSSDREILLIL